MTKELNELQIAEQIKKILKSNRTTYEKKIALFNLVVKGLEVEKSDVEKEQRINYLLQSHLYNELSKQMVEYLAKITKEEKQNKNFWKYTFLSAETGKLKLTKSDNQGNKFYLDFKQEVANPKEEKSLIHLEERIDKDNEACLEKRLLLDLEEPTER
ncbi:2809_t:CDS:2 [Ambispora leptoticha]|uniref:2809_t:CDS:1 n=1 Tax=Ambispora leptoticha TaxID=144679 RepID=A0A9N9DZU5_9GLOM|nr:2809_t:CDS:2 [Ambispora leptoticha]